MIFIRSRFLKKMSSPSATDDDIVVEDCNVDTMDEDCVLPGETTELSDFLNDRFLQYSTSETGAKSVDDIIPTSSCVAANTMSTYASRNPTLLVSEQTVNTIMSL